MNISKNKATRVLALAISLVAVLATAPVSQALADPPSLPPLNPPPPGFLNCRPTGNGAICEGTRQLTDDPAPTGIFCGTPNNPVELIGADIVNQRATRYYNRDGNLTLRVIHEDIQGTITNPVTGLAANIEAHGTRNHEPAVPGDLSTFTERSTGTTRFYLPGAGVLVHDAGLSIIVFSGDEAFIQREEGQHDQDDYFGLGDTSVMAALCAALGSPGTP
jgi:hypothetical protein